MFWKPADKTNVDPLINVSVGQNTNKNIYIYIMCFLRVKSINNIPVYNEGNQVKYVGETVV